MADKGANILAIGQTHIENHQFLSLPEDLPPWFIPVLHLPVLQLLAYHRAIYNGCDPDNPQQLTAVVSLEDI